MSPFETTTAERRILAASDLLLAWCLGWAIGLLLPLVGLKRTLRWLERLFTTTNPHSDKAQLARYSRAAARQFVGCRLRTLASADL